MNSKEEECQTPLSASIVFLLKAGENCQKLVKRSIQKKGSVRTENLHAKLVGRKSELQKFKLYFQLTPKDADFKKTIQARVVRSYK